MDTAIERNSAPAFAAWLDDFFASYYHHRPVNATFIGVHTYDDRLPDPSGAGLADLQSDLTDLQRRLHALPPEPLTPAQSLDHQLAEGFLEIERWECISRHGLRGNPSLIIADAVFGVMSLFLRDFAPFDQRVAAARDRLESFPSYFRAAPERVRFAPAPWIVRAIRECDGTLAFLTEGVDLLASEAGITDLDLRQAAIRAAAAVAAFRAELDDALRRSPPVDVACGPAALDLLLRRGHFIDREADEIVRYARDELIEVEARLTERARRFGTADWHAVLGQLAELHPKPEQYYAQFHDVWEAHREVALEHELLSWPDYPIRYVPRPRWTRAAAPRLYFLFYRAPAAFDPVPVVDYLVEPLEPDMPADDQERVLRTTNNSVIKLNHVVHHGGIGHHIQNWHAYRAASRIGQIAAVDCASRIAMACGGTMAEGWACYATELMAEIGFLTPLEELAELHTRARMAARAVVDVNLHTARMTLDEAAAFYRERTAMSPEAAWAEAVKNSMFPGSGLMYLVGTDQIRALRHERERALGSAFRLREFHDQFLSFGSVPVALVAHAMLADP